MKNLKSDFPVLAIAALSFILTFSLAQPKTLKSEQTFLVPPPDYVERMQFGFKESVADSFWLRWVQDVDTCYSFSGPVKQFEQLTEPERIERARQDILFNPRIKNCDNSWAFKMLDAVTKLDPRFIMPYLLGAPALSVLVEDYEGSSIIFDRGVTNYPGDWQISYRAAYHFMYDKHDLPKAARLLNQAADNGAPSWLRSLAARLYTKSGQIELALSSLESYRKILTKKTQTDEIDRRIAALQMLRQEELSKAQ